MISFIDRDILGKHFQAVEETMSLTCISCSDIVCRCVFVPSASAGVSGYMYVSPVLGTTNMTKLTCVSWTLRKYPRVEYTCRLIHSLYSIFNQN